MSRPSEVVPLDEEDLTKVYEWVDTIPLSRPKRNINRDFSDGVLVAEIFKYFLPNLVDLHNYPPANAVSKKIANWETLNKKLFKKLGFQITQNEINQIVTCVPDVIENIIRFLKEQVILT